MKNLVLWVAACFLFSRCGNHSPEPPKTTTEEKSFFPVAEYIQGEIKVVDSMPVGILKKTIRGNKKDSGFIERPEFHSLASEFTSPELSKTELEKNYNENSFADQSTENFTFTYSPLKPDAVKFGRIDVLVKPGQTSDKVRSIYLERSYVRQDTTVNERLYWKANSSFSITTEKKYKEKEPIIEQLIVIWNPSNY